MEIERIIIELEVNKDIFKGLFTGLIEEEYFVERVSWKVVPS